NATCSCAPIRFTRSWIPRPATSSACSIATRVCATEKPAFGSTLASSFASSIASHSTRVIVSSRPPFRAARTARGISAMRRAPLRRVTGAGAGSADTDAQPRVGERAPDLVDRDVAPLQALLELRRALRRQADQQPARGLGVEEQGAQRRGDRLGEGDLAP